MAASFVHEAIDWSVEWVEAAGALLVVGGLVITSFRLVRIPFLKSTPPLAPLQIRLGLGMFLALGLEFLLAADILRTAVSPSFDDVGMLAAIAAIRTALNFFLGREFIDGQHQLEALDAAKLSSHSAGPPSLPRRPSRHRAHLPTPSFRESLRRAIRGPLWPAPTTPQTPSDGD